MTALYLFPGSFSPPTRGHLHLVKKALKFLPRVTIVCSTNEDKPDNWFTEEESKAMWQSYDLPRNVEVVTLDEVTEKVRSTKDIVMIRGIRNDDDAEHEKGVMIRNRRDYGIEQFHYIYSDDEYLNVSSSRARKLAEALKLEELSKIVSPMVVTKLLEKVLEIKNLFMVVGQPGSGKSTFLRKLAEVDKNNVFINTDKINKRLRPVIDKEFPGWDMIDLILNHEDELMEKIKDPWMNFLSQELRKVPKGINVFIEIPYGMRPEKAMFRFVGGKVICVSCGSKISKKRVEERGTPELVPLIERIPDVKESRRIAKANKLDLTVIHSGCSKERFLEKAEIFNKVLKGEKIDGRYIL